MALTSKEHAKTALEVASKRVALYLAGLDFAILFLYAAGNAQGFLDATQARLASWAERASWALAVAAMIAALSRLILPPRRGERPAFGAAAAWALLSAVAVVLGVAGSLLIALAGGLR